MKRLIALLAVLIALPAAAARNSFPENATPAQFAEWQTLTRALLGQILYNGPAPAVVPLEAEFGAKEKRESFEITFVKFHDRPGHLTQGWLARPLPPRAARLPVVIALHGHGGTALQTFDPREMYYFGDLFARRGYLVLALDIGHDFIDYEDSLVGYGPLPRDVPFPYMGQRVWMALRGLDLIETLPDADPQSIGIVGLSNGGMTAMFAAAMDTRIKLTVAAGSLIMHERMWHRELLHCRCQYLDKMDGGLDYSDVFALIAPRPLIVQSGVRDPIFPIHSAEKAFKKIQAAYALAGAPDLVLHDVHPGRHEFNAAVPSQWFAKFLPLP